MLLSMKSESENRSVMSDSLWSHVYIVPGILQAAVLELVAIPFSRGSSQPRDQTQISHIAMRLQDSLLFEPPGKPKDTRLGILSFLSDPGIEPGSPALQADSLPAELPGKLINKYS